MSYTPKEKLYTATVLSGGVSVQIMEVKGIHMLRALNNDLPQNEMLARIMTQVVKMPSGDYITLEEIYELSASDYVKLNEHINIQLIVTPQ